MVQVGLVWGVGVRACGGVEGRGGEGGLGGGSAARADRRGDEAQRHRSPVVRQSW